MNEFVLDRVFHRIDYDIDGETVTVYWREVKDEGEGYMLYWPADDECHHTYHHPERTFGESL
jgi:hypothetical protein